ncbi:MAG: carbamoyl-phosphate synthase large subunit [Nitrospirota bacterium]|nr:carbamoyl-phosphate synthase large subunit [Nitrospirota bacterium]
MPKRTDIKKILLVGSGPIVIGQACEFDYSGTQACKALREEGYEVVLINSNPATIMTDPNMADRTYIEPITPEVVEMIIAKERPQALLPTMGGQTALGIAVALSENGVLERYGVELIGAKLPAIKKAEDRESFKLAMKRIGLHVPESADIHSKAEAMEIIDRIGFPAIIRPSFTMGGTGGGIAYNIEEFEEMIERALDLSPTREVLVEKSLLGWKEYELEVMRDMKDNVVIICSIENFDPMGVHTGDSITVAPAQTLTDKEYQIMRDAALKIIREIGVDTGGSNIQFAINPVNGDMIIIEMNPRVSRSSALASKATGFAIAKIAAKLAVGYTLDEIRNDITRETPASFEPTIDYVVVKFPRFAFEKFPKADQTLTTQMKSVGEAMAIGRTFKEALQKSLRSLEIDANGLIQTDRRVRRRDPRTPDEPLTESVVPHDHILDKLAVPNRDRLWYVADALRSGMDVDEIYRTTAIDPWFLRNIEEIVVMERELEKLGLSRDPNAPLDIDGDTLRAAKEYGFSDSRLADLLRTTEKELRAYRKGKGIVAVYKTVDTCGAEFPAYTPYLYSTYEEECEANPTDRKKVIILGGGPNRIGQGIEFDYCCVHGAFALKEEGFETIMVNCNPETVSTDYDTSDRLYFEPLTFEDVMNIVEKEKPYGVIPQFGGQTPLKLAVPLERAGVPILGTSPDSIDRAEDRERFKDLINKLELLQPECGTATSPEEAVRVAEGIGYPVVVRPSYVLGGRAMEIVYDTDSLQDYMKRAVKASPDHPVLVDKYLRDAVEVDVDAVGDGEDVYIGGIMEHIEEAGIHSGDSACSLPPYSLPGHVVDEIRRQTRMLALELNVIGLMNIQFAVKDEVVYILEVNPRASRTSPFVSKATGVPLAKVAARVMVGRTLKDLGLTEEKVIEHVAVKEAVFPFTKFPGVDTVLGPEMKSTGEVMGIDADFGIAFLKAQMGAFNTLPSKGRVCFSLRNEDKKETLVQAAKTLVANGFEIEATRGTAGYLAANGIPVTAVNKVHEGRPHIVDNLKNGEICMVVNTVSDAISQKDSYDIRRTALNHKIPYFTTLAGAKAAAVAIDAVSRRGIDVMAIQDYYHSEVTR